MILNVNYGASGPESLVIGKKVCIFNSRGDVFKTGVARVINFHKTYWRAALGFGAFSHISFVHSEALVMVDGAGNTPITASGHAIDSLIAA